MRFPHYYNEPGSINNGQGGNFVEMSNGANGVFCDSSLAYPQAWNNHWGDARYPEMMADSSGSPDNPNTDVQNWDLYKGQLLIGGNKKPVDPDNFDPSESYSSAWQPGGGMTQIDPP
jgi:hypothetical protein